MKLYWADSPDAERWHGVESEAEAIEAGRALGMDFHGAAIWIAPVDEETDDDDRFWDAVAHNFLCEAESINESLAEEGWVAFDGPWLGRIPSDRDRILANALRQVLGPHPAWRTVDTSKARRVEL